MAEGKNKKRQHAGYVSYLNKFFDIDLKNLMESNGGIMDAEKNGCIENVKATVEAKLEKVIELSEKITDTIEDPKDYEKELHDSLDIAVNLIQKIQSICSIIENSQNACSVENTVATSWLK